MQIGANNLEEESTVFMFDYSLWFVLNVPFIIYLPKNHKTSQDMHIRE